MTSPQAQRDVFLGIRGSKIVEIAPWNQQKAKKMIDASKKIVLPGLINGHTHLAMTLLRGLSDDLSLNDWLYKCIFPVEAKLLSPEFVKSGAELAALEAIRFGVTTVCDMYYFEDVTADVIDKAGIRGVLSEAVLDFPVNDNKKQDDSNYRILDKMRDSYRNHPRITPCLGPHAPYTCSDATLQKVEQYAGEHGTPIIMHVCETKGEVEQSLKQYKKTPVKRLSDLRIMDHASVFAHCVHLTHEDIELLARHKTSAIYNPESNMKLGSGVSPVPQLLNAGVKVGLGTDGAASNNDTSLFREMDSAAKLQKLTHSDNTAMTAFQALELATVKGAEALGLGDRVGTLEVGKDADVIIVDTAFPHMQPLHDAFSQLVYSASGLEVETVICHGKILLEGFKHKTLDEEKIYRQAQEHRESIQSCLK